MAKRLVDTDLWNNEDIIKNFTAEDKYFWLYLLTSPHNSICGVMKASAFLIARDMSYSEDCIENLLYRFEHTHKAIKVDKATKEIVILNWGKFNWNRSRDILNAIESNCDKIKSLEIQSIVRLKASEFFENIESKKDRGVPPPIPHSISITNIYNYIKKYYSRYNYGSRLNKKETCKRLQTILNSKDKKKRLYSLQILLAYACYLKEKYDSDTESCFIKHSAEFLSNMVYDYAEKVDDIFREQMLEKYGEEWEKIKFKVVE